MRWCGIWYIYVCLLVISRQTAHERRHEHIPYKKSCFSFHLFQPLHIIYMNAGYTFLIVLVRIVVAASPFLHLLKLPIEPHTQTGRISHLSVLSHQFCCFLVLLSACAVVGDAFISGWAKVSHSLAYHGICLQVQYDAVDMRNAAEWMNEIYSTSALKYR